MNVDHFFIIKGWERSLSVMPFQVVFDIVYIRL